MPGVRIVEEPTNDLWFPPDQCVVPDDAAMALAETGFMGLGDFFDPYPQAPVGGEGLGARKMKLPKGTTVETDPFSPAPYPAESVAQVRRGEQYELTPALEEEIERQQREEWEWRAKLPALYQHAHEEVVKDIQNKVMFISTNFKTGYSFNIRIQKYRGVVYSPGELTPAQEQSTPEHYRPFEKELVLHPVLAGTCNPTSWCMEHCYAKVGRFVSWDEQHWYNLSRQQARYLQNLIVSEMYAHAGEDEIEEQAKNIYDQVSEHFHEVDRATGQLVRGGKFPVDAPLNLRWNGGGDFNKGTIRLVNKLTEMYPDFIVWGFSRKKESAKYLVPRHNLRLQFSLDPSTRPSKIGVRGDTVEELVQAAYRMHGQLCYATHLIGDPNINTLRQVIASSYGDKARINTVFGFHCGSLHTEIGDVMECSATNPRIYATCQVCRWCMMNDQERASTPGPDGRVGVQTPNQSFFAHGGEPDFKKINLENEARVKAGRDEVDPVTEDEAFSVG